MFNPIDLYRKFKSRLGKPIRPIIELQKGCAVVNILTTPVQDGNIITDTYHSEGWEVQPTQLAHAIYIDGVFKGMGFFADEVGAILNVSKNVEAYQEVDVFTGGVKTKELKRLYCAFKGIIGQLLDAQLIERGSALKPSLTQTLIYCILVAGFFFMAGMSYGH